MRSEKDGKKPPRTEYERKFLVIVSKLPKRLPKAVRIAQGYLTLEPLQVRIRIEDGRHAMLQIKGPGQFESSLMPLPLVEGTFLAERYLSSGTRLVEKDRYKFPAGKGLYWELDVFRGPNDGLCLAEIETPTERFRLDPKTFPAWIGPDVSDDKRFKNRHLAARPFRKWPEDERKRILKQMGR